MDRGTWIVDGSGPASLSGPISGGSAVPGSDPTSTSEDTSEVEIRDLPEGSRYVLTVDGERAGYVAYDLADGVMTVVHTVVRPAFSGRGLAGRLAAHVLTDVRARGLRLRPVCPYMAAYVERHPTEAEGLLVAAETPEP